MNLEYPKDLVKHGKVKQISPSLFQVKEQTVKFQKKKGRVLLICSCRNHTSYCLENPLCIHKISVIGFLWDNNFNERLDKLIKEYENYKKIGTNTTINWFLEDLKKIKYLR